MEPQDSMAGDDENSSAKIRQKLQTANGGLEGTVLPLSPTVFGVGPSKFNKICSISLTAVLVIFLVLILLASCFILYQIVVIRGTEILQFIDANLTDFYRYNKNGSGAIHLISGDTTGPNKSISIPNIGPCWFHPTVFPYSCGHTFCESVEYEVSLNESISRIQFSPVVSLHQLNSVPDKTPCGPDSWCIAGQCLPVARNISQGESPEIQPNFFWQNSKIPVNGGWSSECNRPKCLVDKFANKIHWKLLMLAAKCPGMPCSAYTKEMPRLLFRSCTNPLPAYGGKACGDPGGPWPIVWGPVCHDCPRLYNGEDARKTAPSDILAALCGHHGRFVAQQTCACRTAAGTLHRVDDGAPCHQSVSWTPSSATPPSASGRCLFGACVAIANEREMPRRCLDP